MGDFDNYKLSKPDGLLLHLVARIGQRSWELSIEVIETNTEFKLSLLEPAAPDSIPLNAPILTLHQDYIKSEQVTQRASSVAPAKTTIATTPGGTTTTTTKRANKKTNKQMAWEDYQERRHAIIQKRKRAEVMRAAKAKKRAAALNATTVTAPTVAEMTTTTTSQEDSCHDMLMDDSIQTHGDGADLDVAASSPPPSRQSSSSTPRENLFRPCEDDMIGDMGISLEHARTPATKRRAKVERELKKLGTGVTQERVLQALLERQVQ